MSTAAALARKRSPRGIWLGLFVFINIVCAIVIVSTHQLMGETAGLFLVDAGVVFPITLVVIACYAILLGVVYPLLCRIKVAPSAINTDRTDRAVSISLFSLQLAFIAFFTITGTFGAGSTTRSESVWSMFWVLISVDSLFCIYYGFYRNSRLFWPNLAIAIISNLLRGWSGIFILIAFMESARMIRAGKFSFGKALLMGLGGMLLYPALYAVKLQVRLMSSTGAEIDFLAMLEQVFSTLRPSDYGDLLVMAILQIFERLHHVSNLIVVYQNANVFSHYLEAGQMMPFWMEGIHGLAIYRITGITPLADFGHVLADVIEPMQTDVSWNANPTFAGWFFVAPFWSLLYLTYVFGLMTFAIVIIKRLRGTIFAYDMLWFACLSYLLAGWLASFVLLVHSFIVFYLFHLFVNRFSSRRSLSPRSGQAPSGYS